MTHSPAPSSGPSGHLLPQREKEDRIPAFALFDPLTGEMLRKVPRYSIFPKSHYVTPRETLLAAVDENTKCLTFASTQHSRRLRVAQVLLR